MEILSKFNERLAELMQEHEITSERLAVKIGVTGSVIRRWTYRDTNIKLSNLLRVADYFNCSLEFLLGRTEKVLDYTPKPLPKFGRRFREIIMNRGVSSYRLRNLTKIKGSHIYKWDRGAEPRLSSLLELANFMNITVDYLIGREND
jgi:transcriptional regulator with XRE-family HTH domain